MHSMTKKPLEQFTHTFANKQKLVLTVDLSACPPKIASSVLFKDLAPEVHQEYNLWVNGFVFPTLYEKLSIEQILAMGDGTKPQ